MKGVDSSTVLHSLDADGLLTLTLNRPERHNTWNREMESSLHGLLEQASEDGDVRVIVLTGAGRTFSPGLDVEDLTRLSLHGLPTGQSGRRPIQLPALIPKPIVCAINGACAGLGLMTALMSDIRFVADDAKLTTAYARRGLPAEEAISWILPRIVGHAVALDLLLSGRVVLGSEAAAIGLVHRSVPREDLHSVAYSYARDMAIHCSPAAMAAAKRQVYQDWFQPLPASRLDARRLVANLQAASPDYQEGVQSFVEKRAPRFASYAAPVDCRDYPEYESGAADES